MQTLHAVEDSEAVCCGGNYRDLLLNSSVTLPFKSAHIDSAWHLYVVRPATGIVTGMHYPTTIHLQGAYADAGYPKRDFPVTEGLAREVLSLPMYAELKAHSLKRTAETIMSNAEGKCPLRSVPRRRYSSPGVSSWNSPAGI